MMHRMVADGKPESEETGSSHRCGPDRSGHMQHRAGTYDQSSSIAQGKPASARTVGPRPVAPHSSTTAWSACPEGARLSAGTATPVRIVAVVCSQAGTLCATVPARAGSTAIAWVMRGR